MNRALSWPVAALVILIVAVGTLITGYWWWSNCGPFQHTSPQRQNKMGIESLWAEIKVSRIWVTFALLDPRSQPEPTGQNGERYVTPYEKAHPPSFHRVGMESLPQVDFERLMQSPANIRQANPSRFARASGRELLGDVLQKKVANQLRVHHLVAPGVDGERELTSKAGHPADGVILSFRILTAQRGGKTAIAVDTNVVRPVKTVWEGGSIEDTRTLNVQVRSGTVSVPDQDVLAAVEYLVDESTAAVIEKIEVAGKMKALREQESGKSR